MTLNFFLQASEPAQEQEKPEVYIITHGKEAGNLDGLELDPLMANLEQKTFEDLPINKPLDIGELAEIASKQNSDSDIGELTKSDSDSKSTKDVIEGWIEKEKIGTEKKAIVMIDEVPAQSISQPHFSIKDEWEDMKKKEFEDSGSVPLAFDLCFLSKHKNIQFVIIMTPSTPNIEKVTFLKYLSFHNQSMVKGRLLKLMVPTTIVN